MLPVPHTITRLIRLTLVGVLSPLVADITAWQKRCSQRPTNRLGSSDQPPGQLADGYLLDIALRSSYQPV
jgi:hypothetical protein